MKKKYLVLALFGWQTLNAQVKIPEISIAEVSRYIGKTVKVNYGHYQTGDNGRLLTVYLNPERRDKSLMLMLTGESRKKILTEMRSRRELNQQIKSPLDTSITAIGKIVWYQGRLAMRASQAYLGADLQMIKE